MTKQSDRTPPKSDKKPIDSPNPQELKQNRPNNMAEDSTKNDTVTVESDKKLENASSNNNLDLQRLNRIGILLQLSQNKAMFVVVKPFGPTLSRRPKLLGQL